MMLHDFPDTRPDEAAQRFYDSMRAMSDDELAAKAQREAPGMRAMSMDEIALQQARYMRQAYPYPAAQQATDARARELDGDTLREAYEHEACESAMDDRALGWLTRIIILAVVAAGLGATVATLLMVARG